MRNMRMAVLVALGLVAVSVSISQAQEPAKNIDVKTKMSNDRIADIRRIVKAKTDVAPSLDVKQRDELIEHVKRQLPNCDESKPPANPTMEELRKIVDKDLSDKYPMTQEQVKAKAMEEAIVFYHVAVLGEENIRVKFRRIGIPCDVSGVFNGWDTEGKSIKIGKQVIPFVDILPEYQYMFNQALCDQKRAEYVDMRLKDYNKNRNDYSMTQYTSTRRNFDEENLDAGYIYYRPTRTWKSPAEIAVLFIDEFTKSSKKPDTSVKEEPKLPSAVVKEVEVAEQKPLEISDEKVPMTFKRLKREALEAMDAKAAEIRRDYLSGPDSDQGYGLAVWGMTRHQYNLIFNDKDDAKGGGNPERQVFDKGFVREVEYYFINNTLYKVIVNFRVTTSEAMTTVIANIAKRYGKSEEDKKQDVLAASITAPADGKAAPPPPPQAISNEIRWTWVGQVSRIGLTVKGDAAKETYTMVQLVKESTTIYQSQMGVMEESAKNEEKMRKKKEIEEAKRFENF